MSKFKVGDTVVVVSPRMPSMFGTKYVVKRVKEAFDGEGFIISDLKSGRSGWHEDALVSEEVFESGLYRAMKEDDDKE